MTRYSLRNAFGILFAFLCVAISPTIAHAAKSVKSTNVSKERLVLMPLRVAEEDKGLQGAMETALVEGLQRKYEVFSGEQVAQKARQIFNKESNSAKKECDETRCMQGIAEAFQAELIATANVTKQDGGYFLALSVQNIFDNKVEYSKTLTCEGCSSFKVVEKLKELVGMSAAVATQDIEELRPNQNINDSENALWVEVQKGNTKDDYEAYLAQYPKGKYIALAKSRMKKLQEQAAAELVQQDQSAWERANSMASEASYAEYLNNYPQGRYAALGKARIAKLRKEAAEVGRKERDAQLQREAEAARQSVTNSAVKPVTSTAHQPIRPALNIAMFGASDHQISIAVVPFSGEDLLDQSLTEVVSNDLLRTGLFKLLDPAEKTPHQLTEVNYSDWGKVDALTIGSVVKLADGRIEIRFRLLDTAQKTQLLGLAVAVKSDQIRAGAHRIADLIYEKLTGSPGVFGTRIAYVNRQGKDHSLIISDSDGYGGQALIKSPQPIMSPAWSPDGKSMAYVSFEQGRAMVYVQNLAMQKRLLLVGGGEGNTVPAWSPDGQQLAVVSARDGQSHIYLVRPDGSDWRKITVDGAINDEPNFSPDGQSLIFTSNRGGSVQIYRMPVNGGEPERLTSEGDGNFTPRYSPDGKSIVFSHWKDGRFYIAVKDFESKKIQILTSGGVNKKPNFSPNGKYILFATEANGRGVLATVSRDGRVTQKISAQDGDILEPMWGPVAK
ncbi:MAG TPA: Tol-Pal system beta propeller repeat protein TolB [Sideroxyarcus sp.]|nr:Tol-Pal system beta propeller repeat protein TolB [Sideroxyarcus sp.]